jgi:hypothetical protein
MRPPPNWVSPNSAISKRGSRSGRTTRPTRQRRRRDEEAEAAAVDDDDDDDDDDTTQEKELPTGSDPLDFLQDNPKKEGAASRARYELYKAAKTVSEFFSLGGTNADLAWDIEHDFVITTAA